MRLNDRQWTCPYKCEGDEAGKNDTDYASDSKGDDEHDGQLTGRAVAGEQQLARTYGWKTNVIANQDEDDERRIFFEAPGHYAVACAHDVGVPQESSLVNSENTVGRLEAEMLLKKLEPWELEAAHVSSGRS